jgi:hypothetical protein
MKALPSPKETLALLADNQLFKDWQGQHPRSFLSHFFCPVSSDFKAKSNWEIGYYDSSLDKITVFKALEGDFEIKPADDVFKKEAEKVEKLELDEVKVPLDSAAKTFKDKLPEYFPQEQLGDGFLILQKYQGKTVWNLSFISKSLKFLNLKIGVVNGKVHSHEEVALIQQ